MTSPQPPRDHNSDHTEDQSRGDHVGGAIFCIVSGPDPVAFIRLSRAVEVLGGCVLVLE